MKIKKYKYLLAFLVLITYTSAMAQSKETALKIGDKVPDLVFEKILNYSVSSAHLSDLYKRKLVILDFWTSYCSVCINQFPRLYELQKKFGDKILILPVGFDANREGSIEAFVNSRRGTKRELKLPTAVISIGNGLMDSLFAHSSVPTEIWIDSSGILRAITDHLSVNEIYISKILKNENISLPNKPVTKLTSDEDLFKIGFETRKTNIHYGSILTGYIDSIKDNLGFDHQMDSSIKRLVALNTTVFRLYGDAYRDLIANYTPNRILLEDSISHPYRDFNTTPNPISWDEVAFNQKNLFCYELILPASYSLSAAKHYMAQDLDRYFGLISHIQIRKVKCLALVRTSKRDLIRSTSQLNSEFSEDQLDVSMRNVSVDGPLLAYLENFLPSIILNETGYRDKIDIDFHLTQPTLMEIKTSLQKFDLDLVEVEREIPMLLLSDQPTTNE